MDSKERIIIIGDTTKLSQWLDNEVAIVASPPVPDLSAFDTPNRTARRGNKSKKRRFWKE